MGMKGEKTMDNINPSHYKTGKFECIEVMLETQGVDVVKGFCIGNAFKYLYRHNNKNQDEDIKKANGILINIWKSLKTIKINGSKMQCRKY